MFFSRAVIASYLFLSGAAIAAPDEPLNSVEVLQPPRPEYPGPAAFFGVQGVCEVRFALLDYGVFIDVQNVACSNLIFCKSSTDAVRGSRFKVIDVPSTPHPGERHNIVYPINYNLDGRPAGQFGDLQECPPLQPGLIG